MTDNTTKEIWYIKLHTTFWKRTEVKYILTLNNGYQKAAVYQKLLLLTANTKGYLEINSNLPYTKQQIASLIEEDEEIVQEVLDLLEKMELLERTVDNVYFLNEVPSLTASISDSDENRRKVRQIDRSKLEDAKEGREFLS